ncbi:hypothetical protein ACFYVM_09010 [Streptomyces sp. NPDC003280]|uniref:hypothetical protein n=1 Tax=Streptomyces sp. NPDC003280 TaxID=3364680 RepID=UPI0036ADD99D
MRNGQFRSLIVRATADTLVVLAGTHTLQALLAHGPGLCGLITTVDGEELCGALCGGQEWEPVARCEIVTCDDATAPRINLVDNRSARRLAMTAGQARYLLDEGPSPTQHVLADEPAHPQTEANASSSTRHVS